MIIFWAEVLTSAPKGGKPAFTIYGWPLPIGVVSIAEPKAMRELAKFCKSSKKVSPNTRGSTTSKSILPNSISDSAPTTTATPSWASIFTVSTAFRLIESADVSNISSDFELNKIDK